MPQAGRREVGAGRSGAEHGDRRNRADPRPAHRLSRTRRASAFRCDFAIELSDDRQIRRADRPSPTTRRPTSPTPATSRSSFELTDKKARYIRVTATRLWKRTNDYVFALAELQAVAEKKNLALGAAVTALDSIEAGRWSTKHLVDDYSSRARLGDVEAFKAALAKRQTLEAQTRQARRRSGKRPSKNGLTRPTRTELRDDDPPNLAEIDARLAALAGCQAMVYAAAHRLRARRGAAARCPPRPVHFLHRGSDKTPGDEVAPGALSCLPGLPADFALADPADEGSRRAALAHWITDPQQSADRAVDRQSRLAVSFRPRHRRYAQRFRPHGLAADASGAARLAGGELGNDGWIAENRQRGARRESNVAWSLKRLHRLILDERRLSAVVARQLRNSRRSTRAISICGG